jgi:hypothetical protein
MKNFKLSLSIVLAFGFGAFSTLLVQCNSRIETPTDQICMDYSNSHFTGANLDTVLSDLARYNGTHVPAVEADMRNNGIEKRASRVCTFPLDTLKKFIYFLEKYSSQHRVSPEDLAIGFYYGVYPKKMISTTGEDYGSLHTLFMVPAALDQKSNDYIDYDPINNVPLATHIRNEVKQEKKGKEKGEETGKVKRKEPFMAYILSMSETAQSRSLAASAGSLVQPMAKNQGGLCPPRCPPSSSLQTLLSGTESY